VPGTYVYIDAFNLYYGALKGTQYRWLNLETLCRLMLPRDDIRKIHYFTALVSARPHDPDQPIRQQTYVRALSTLPTVSVHYGRYLQSKVRMPLATPVAGQPRTALVVKTEEKGSDVNLATHLLCDAYEQRFDVAVLITNDSDLVEPVNVVNQRLNKPVGILNPHPNPSFELQRVAAFLKQIRAGVLQASQFPPTLTDSVGSFHKPAGW
jgi:NYN domain